MPTPEPTRRAAAARWREAILSPWSSEQQGEMSAASPSLDGYVPFGAEPPARLPLRRLNIATKDAIGPRKRTPKENMNRALSKDTLSATLPRCTLFAELRRSAARSFDPEVDEPVLRELWRCGKLGQADSFARVSPCWRTLGFRQDDPGVDLQVCSTTCTTRTTPHLPCTSLRNSTHLQVRRIAHAHTWPKWTNPLTLTLSCRGAAPSASNNSCTSAHAAVRRQR